MTAKARFEITALVASTIGVLLIICGVLVSSGETEPRRLSVDQEARQIGGARITAGGASNVSDPSVRVASHQVVMPLAASAAALGADPATSVRIEHVTSGDDKYRWPGTAQQPIRVTSEMVKIQLSGGDAKATYIVAGGAEDAGPQKVSAEFTVKLNAGENTLKVMRAAEGDAQKAVETGTTIRLRAPAEDRVARPTVSKAFNNKHANATGVNFQSEAGVRVYGGYVRVEGGLGAGNLGNLRFALFDKSKTPPEFLSERVPNPTSISSSRLWSTELQLPRSIARNFRGVLLAYTVDGDHHVFTETPINFTLVEDRLSVGPPEISDVLIGSSGNSAADPSEFPRTWVVRDSKRTFRLKGSVANIPEGDARVDSRMIVHEISDGRPIAIVNEDGTGFSIDAKTTEWTSRVITVDTDGDYEYEAHVVQGDALSESSQRVRVLVRTKGPSIRDIEPRNLLFGPGRITLTVYFDRERPLTRSSAETLDSYAITGPSVDESDGYPPREATFDPRENSVTLSFQDYPDDGEYTILIKKKTNGENGQSDGVVDIYGNSLESDDPVGERFTIIRSKLSGPSVRPGISGRTGPYVAYPEFTEPRTVPDGFNPNDKVETRVVRLYYYRDAHRVAQIINREVKSFNRQGVDMARQLADKARSDADRSTESRKEAERAAILKAQETRRIESQLRVAEEGLNRSVQELTNARRQGAQATDAVVQQLEATTRSFANQLDSLRRDVERARTNEAQANELTQQLEEQEKLAREEQFRREVAAAHTDPDTYVPGVPTSDDPVQQVSVSVIGEGLIHLRGPLKGVNMIRTMIDQIDQPVGQVRVSVHTVQINGERQERMEDVANIIQRYIDHARFLTMQSSEMLRKAIVQVASRKAEEAMALNPGESQEDRDRRYLHAFFGQDFIRELEVMDSEFLQTGNKLLALHSMDTTSLSSALNLLALANNTTRLEIFHEFDRMVQGELPCAEASYLEAGLTAIRRSRLSLRHPPKFYPMAQNARFESLRGFFNMEIGHPDTMTPLQREFVRLAQIFKSRLITELEYRQRVMERAVIEQRLGDRNKELRDAKWKEDHAQNQLTLANVAVNSQRDQVMRVLTQLLASRDQFSRTIEHFKSSYDTFDEPFRSFETWKQKPDGTRSIRISLLGRSVELAFDKDTGRVRLETDDPDLRQAYRQNFEQALADFRRVYNSLKDIKFTGQDAKDLKSIDDSLRDVEMSIEQDRAMAPYKFQENQLPLEEAALLLAPLAEKVLGKYGELENAAVEILSALRRTPPDIAVAYREWLSFTAYVRSSVSGSTLEKIEPFLRDGDQGFSELLTATITLESAIETANRSRRPLDHKKFLDMLIDDLEDKYIELLDGTRAHTANVDNYLKRLTTALDDDFNTQFYHPAFRYIREASTHWDVQFGQTETTSILANNREFAKVDPSATMEFDLPPRDIVFAEALNGAKALMDDVGALANDPTFLAMAKMKTQGSGTSPSPGSTGGFGVVRDVLPGLNSSTAEQIMAHNAGARPQLGSNLENLIPDPAIYKFETGTGFEIRPVIQPDGQAVVFNFDYMYTTNIREPVRADEKHLGRVRRHFIHTDVQLSNFELREVSRYTVALKAARTSRGVPLLEDIPVVGVLWRPLPSSESSLQQNIILSQATIFPTLFDLMGLRWAPVVSDMDPLRVSNREFIVRGRHRALENRVYDYASSQVDEFLRIPEANRRTDLYRSQETIPWMHPNGYQGPGLDLRDSQLQEGYQPERVHPPSSFIPGESREGALFRPGRNFDSPPGTRIESYPLDEAAPERPDPVPIVEPANRIRLP